jgi:hypothetical protein
MAVHDSLEQIARERRARVARTFGPDDASRLRWLLKFAAAEFETMRASRFRRWQREIREFAALSASSFETIDNPVSREVAGQLAIWVADGLSAYARGISWDIPQVSIPRSVIPNEDRSSYNGRWSDTFLMSAADVVQAAGNVLRCCAAQGCSALFAKNKRRIFCSERCSGGERMRRFQQNSTRYKSKRRKYYLKSLARKRARSKKH